MHARVVLGVGKGVLFREVSSVQRCPHREREVPLYTLQRGNPPNIMCAYNKLNHTPTPQDPEELTSIEEDLDSLLANVEYIQSNIVELQNELIAVDDSKVNYIIRTYLIYAAFDVHVIFDYQNFASERTGMNDI